MIAVLIVDDEEAVRTNLYAFLQDEGFETLAVASAEAALEVLQGRSVHVVIADVRLPGMDGNALIQAAHKLQPRARFLIHTGSSYYSPPAAVRKLGIRIKHLFRKPVADMSLIAQAIHDLVDHDEQSLEQGG